MLARLVALCLALIWSADAAVAQQSQPVPLYPGAGPRSIEPEPLPPLAPAPEAPPRTEPAPAAVPAPPAAAAAAPDAPPVSPPVGRVFCEQPVTVRLADPEAVADRFRPFLGIWSDASWTPQLCAALVVENVAPDGTATILYVFGPMGSNTRGGGGVLQGTGIIRNGELRFQNSDGSQFVFRPLYADLDGSYTTPKSQTYQAVFKRTP